MGWSSANGLYNVVIAVLQAHIPDYNARKDAHKQLIRAFEGEDWDTQCECLGQDQAFDDALAEMHDEERK